MRCRAVALFAVLAFMLASPPNPAARQEPRPPNFIVILADDQGYGDLGSYGHPTIRTPNIDRMAQEGQRWTNFYAAHLCTPSRAQLLTGRYAVRTGLVDGVLFPDSTGGLQPSEITIARLLKQRGYATAMVGKWHLGVLSQYLPTAHGFDSYFGIPYSNDMDQEEGLTADEKFRRYLHPKIEYFNVPLMRNDRIVERPAEQSTLTRRYTDEAIAFIRAHRAQPFFLYLAHNMPHVPLFRSRDFAGRSARGIYGDVIEEIDWNVGRLLDTLRELQIDRNTLVVYTSDNGPWAPYREHSGSAGLLKGAKSTTWEGGMREPAIFWWPGTVPSSVVLGMGSELDLFPTFAHLAHTSVPTDRVMDGYDLSDALRGRTPSPRHTLFYYGGLTLSAVRHDSYKAYFLVPRSLDGRASGPGSTQPELYNVDQDPSEKYDLAAEHPEIVEELRRLAEAHKQTVVPVPNQIKTRTGQSMLPR